MSLRLIESYDSTETVLLENRSFPWICTVENDDDGLRWYVTADLTQVHPHSWVQASAAGVAGIVVPVVEGYVWISTERFMEYRTEQIGTYRIDRALFTQTTTWPDLTGESSVAELLAEDPYEQQMAALEGQVTGFVHLHTHSEMSPLDGLSKMEEIVQQVVEHGQQALAITDHGTCAGHPALGAMAAKYDIKPIYGIEAYFIDGDRTERPGTRPVITSFTKEVWVDVPAEMAPVHDVDGNPTGEMYEVRAAWRNKEVQPDEDAFNAAIAEHEATQKRLKDGYFHLVLWAENPAGLINLWAMSTEGYRDGLYYRPRMDWDTLARHSDGVIASTACLRGPLSVPLLEGDEALAEARLGRLMEIFGDRLYLEIHANQLPEQKKVNEGLVRLSDKHQVPLVAVVDSHYPVDSDHDAHKAWIACQTNTDINDEGDLFAVNLDLFIQSEKQVREALSYLSPQHVDAAVENTAVIASRCYAEVKGTTATPTFSRVGGQAADVERLLDLCMEHWDKTTGKRETFEVYRARFEREMDLLISKGFCGYFLMVADYCLAAKQGRIDGLAKGKPTGRPILVGPGRGSGGGSLVAYLAGITDIDPVDADLLFERFLTEGRTALPDFDVDFPQSKKADLLTYVRDRWGEDHVVSVGTHLRLKNKGIVKDLGRAMKSELPENAYMDLQAVSKIIDEAEAGMAGLGIDWEDLWVQEADRLDPYRATYPALFAMADRLVGRLKTYGKHAAGVVISTEGPLTDRLPLRQGEDDLQMVTQFAMDDLEALGLVKFDLLTLRTLDTIQMAVDLIYEQRGITIDVYSWKEEYADPQVWDEISAAHTLGIFQIETVSGTRLTKRFKPKTVAELADVITLVRPGPMRSGLTESYLKRRNGDEPVSFPDPRMEKVLAKTYGTLLYQEDIMAACMVLAGYDSNEADKVRKILGKKQVEKIDAEGKIFVERCGTHGMDTMAAAALWAQMAEFAKYSFNRAHAFAYAILGYWCAWLKFHYPVQFLTAALTTVDKDRIPDFIKEARRMGFAVQPPDINESKVGFTGSPLSVRYGIDSLKGIVAAAEHIVSAQPFASYEDFLARVVEPKGSKVNMGHVNTLVRIGAFDSLQTNRRALEQLSVAQKEKTDTVCSWKVTGHEGPQNPDGGAVLPCTFDWASEESKRGRTGKPLKNQPGLPKKCSRACRNYTPVASVELDKVEPYTDADIRLIEKELLGVYLSSTPFDQLEPTEREILLNELEALNSEYAQNRVYLIAAIVGGVRQAKDRSGRPMGWATLETERMDLDCVVFSTNWVKYQADLKPNMLIITEVEKTSRGLNLVSLMAVR